LGDKDGKKGVAFFIDEAHIAFNARDWATIGRGALFYLSQHRKLGDIVWPITQSAGNLDKQFRSVAEDFTVMRNEYTARYGMFKGRGRFVRRTYTSEPSGNAEPFDKATFTLDKEGIASCYDTAKGIGVHGNKADIGRKTKGIPIMWVIPGFMLLALLFFLVPWYGSKMAVGWVTGGKLKEMTDKAKEATHKDGAGVQSSAGTFLDGIIPQRTQPGPGNTVPPLEYDIPPIAEVDVLERGQLWVTGVVQKGGWYNITLSDGRTIIESQEEMIQKGIVIDRAGVVFKKSKRRIYMQPVGWRPQPTQADVLGEGGGVDPTQHVTDTPSGAKPQNKISRDIQPASAQYSQEGRSAWNN